MSKTLIWIVRLVPLYIGISLMTAAALNANWREDITCRYSAQEIHQINKDFRINVILGFLPPLWFSTIIVTGGYADGFTFDHGSCVR